jgi:hypothetical protein
VSFFLLWIEFLLQETTLLLAETPSFFLLTEFLLKEMTTLVKEVKNKLRRNCGQLCKSNNNIWTKFGQQKNCRLEWGESERRKCFI